MLFEYFPLLYSATHPFKRQSVNKGTIYFVYKSNSHLIEFVKKKNSQVTSVNNTANIMCNNVILVVFIYFRLVINILN